MSVETHIPVLREAVVRFFSDIPAGVIVDGTVGLGGHAEAILDVHDDVRLLGIDRDPTALAIARDRLTRFGGRVRLVHGSFAEVAAYTATISESIVGFLLDIGISSLQLDDPSRGFSFRHDGPLDMRMDPTGGAPASEWIAKASQDEIRDVLRRFGEERYAGRIARAVVEARASAPIERTHELREIVHRAVPRTYFDAPIDPATRTFQGIRIRVNGELDALRAGLVAGFEALVPGGVAVVISFHSLEDRIVKTFFREKAADCICPPGLPECVCDKQVEAEILTRRPTRADEVEVAANPRARSAKLRAARRTL